MFLNRTFVSWKRSFYKNIYSKITMNSEDSLLQTAKNLVPSLTVNKHKGQDGRIGIIGGSLEYSGAPFFAGMSALRTGADLVHIFCCKEASTPIKSFSPELIVHPILDDDKALILIEQWLVHFHVILIGPGLGREKKVFETVAELIKLCRSLSKPLVIDADGLFLVSQNINLIKNYPGLVLTPNSMEFTRLVKAFLNKTVQPTSCIEESDFKKLVETIGEKVAIVHKGRTDIIGDGRKGIPTIACKAEGSGRRCGGQGDLLSGSLSVFMCWAKNRSNEIIPSINACYAACRLVRECNAAAFKIKGRGMLASDMIDQVAPTFAKLFETHSG